MSRNVDRIIDAATLLGVLTGLIIAIVALVRVTTGSAAEAGPPPQMVIEEWEPYAQVGRRIGAADASVTIIEFGDYQCPVCKAAQPHVDAILRRYPDDVALVYRHLPLPNHAHAYPAARAAECAADQGYFEAFHRELYARDEWKAQGAVADFMSLATRAGIRDLGTFQTCISDPEPRETITDDMAAARDLDVSGTPTFLVNGEKYLGVLDSIFFPAVMKRARR